jgi:hypothetical protein
MVNVAVGVYGGTTPNPIKVFIDNLNNTDDHNFSSSTSFSQNFDLPPGKYMMTVTGVNPNNENSHTVIDVTGNFSVGPLHNDHRKVSVQLYSEIFYFEI